MPTPRRLVNGVLDAAIGKMHGLTLTTMTPAKFEVARQQQAAAQAAAGAARK